MHPERIRSLTEFRIAFILLGISILIPVVVQLYMVRNQMGSLIPNADPGIFMYATAIGPLLKMLAVIIGVDSVTPRGKTPYG